MATYAAHVNKWCNCNPKVSSWDKYLHEAIADEVSAKWDEVNISKDDADRLDVLRYFFNVSKGEKEMTKTEAQIRYEEKVNAAKKAYDEAVRIAHEELENEELKKQADAAANNVKRLYDSYISAGFSIEQAEKFVTIALEKGM